MRKVIYGINVTLDGCCDHTKSYTTEGIHDYFTELMRNVDLIVYGRKTYELMVPFWPDVAKTQSMGKAENEFAQTFDSIPKLVFSRSLHRVEDKNTRIARTPLLDEILKLKQAPGKNISIGGVDVPSQLMQAGLVDEFHIVVHPIIAGKGRRLFDDTDLHEPLHFKLAESTILPSGCIALRYLKE